MKQVNSLIGAPIERVEDLRLLRGRGQYVDDLRRERMLFAHVLRSQVAHGRIISIDTAAAKKRAGVRAVITAAEVAENLGKVPLIPMRLQPLPDFIPYHQPGIADGVVRYVGEPIALVLADTPSLAEDAIEAIDVTIKPLPVVYDRHVAAKNETLLFPPTGTNCSVTFSAVRGEIGDVFDRAPYVRREQMKTNRHTALPMEPRGVIADWDDDRAHVTVLGAAKVPFFNRKILAGMMALAESAVDFIEGDVGGGFGARGEFYPEDFLIPFASKFMGQPVKWTEDRREHLMAMNHAREAECDIEIACTREGKILGLRGQCFIDVGAYMRTNGAVGARNVPQFMSGPYDIPVIHLTSDLLMTNKTPVGTYRGPGRFETDFFRERLLDIVADDLKLDRVAFRRMNLVPKEAMPYALSTITPFEHKDELDSGDYEETLDLCLKEFGWDEKSKLSGQLIDGRYHGVSVGCFIEGGAAGPKETAKIVLEPDGRYAVYVGSTGVGQGIETVFTQIAADALEVPFDGVSGLYHGSTTYLDEGFGAYHSRSVVMGGSAMLDAAEKLREKIREAASAKLGCAPGEVTIVDGASASAPDGKSVPLAGLAPDGLFADGAFLNRKHTWSYGAHAAHVSVDPRTGHVEVIDYFAAEDVGRIINPETLHGQLIGSLVQGLGGAFMEHLLYDEQGQLLTGTLADYMIPTASDFPVLRGTAIENHPSPINPLGAKGAGEGGLISAGGIIANAIADALRDFKVQPRALPMSPQAVWELIEAGRAG